MGTKDKHAVFTQQINPTNPWEGLVFGGLKPWITTSEIRFKSNETDLCISVKLSHTCSSEP